MQRTSFKELELYDFTEHQRPARPTSCYHGRHLCPCCEHAYGRAMDKWLAKERERRNALDFAELSVPRRIWAMWEEHVSKHGIPTPVGNRDNREMGYVPPIKIGEIIPLSEVPQPNKIYRHTFNYSEEVFETHIVHKWTCEGITLWEKIGKRT